MSTTRNSQAPARRSLFSDLLRTLAAAVLLAVFLIQIDAFDRLYAFTRNHEDWELDELVLALAAFAATAAFFAIARVLELRDYDEQVRVAAELRRSQESYDLARQFGKVAVWQATVKDGKLLEIRSDSSSILGDLSTAPSRIAETWLNRVPEEDKGKVEAFQHQMLGGAEAEVEVEHRVLRKDGSIAWVRIRAWAIDGDDPSARRYVGVTTDISDVRERDEALRHQAERFARVSTYGKIDIWELSKDSTGWWHSFGGERLGALHGFPEATSWELAQNWLNNSTENNKEAERVAAGIMEGALESFSSVHAVTTADGDPVWVKTEGWRVSDEGDPEIRYVGVVADITEQHEADLALQRSEGRLAKAHRIARVGNWDWDIAKNELSWSEQVYEIFGLTPADTEPEYQTLLNAVHPDDREEFVDAIGRSLTGPEAQQVYSLDHRILRPNGEVRFVHEEAEVTYDQAGHAIAMAGTIQDITERKEVENRLRRQSMLMQQMTDGVVIIDKDGVAIDCNPAYVESSGLTRAQIIGSDNYSVWRAIDADPEALEAHQQAVERHEYWQGELSYRRKSGRRAQIEVTTLPIHDDNGGYQGRISVVRDITERKAAEEELRVRDRAIATAINGFAFADLDGRITYANKSFLDMWKHKQQSDVIGKPVAGFWEDRDKANAIFDSLLSSDGWVGELTGRRTDDELRTMQVSASVVRNTDNAPTAIMASFVDITEQKAYEVALRRSEERYRLAADFGRTVVWEAYPEQDRLYVSGERLSEGSNSAQQMSDFQRAVLPEDLGVARDAIQEIVHGISDHYELESRVHGADGQIIWLHSKANRVSEPGEQPVRIIGTTRDITEEKQYEERLRSITEDAPVGIITMAQDGTMVTCNPAVERIFGYQCGELEGQSALVLVSPAFGDELQKVLVDYLAGGEPRYIGHGPQEITGMRKDGTEIPLELIVSDTKAAGGAWQFVLIILDVADLRATQNQLRQAQKMEAVGQLTGGIAHDFNNLLMALQLNLEILRSRHRDDESTLLSVKEALETVERGASLTNRLLAFSREQMLKPETVDANLTILDLRKLMETALGANVEISTRLAPDLWPTFVDPGQLENALLNLAINARDAMPAGGALTVTTQNLHQADADAGASGPVRTGDHVLIAVADTGHGMPPEIIERVLEPFFTTKDVGKGTGLGLSMVYGLVKQSGGFIEIESAVGAGTTVKLYFPRAEGMPATKAKQKMAEASKGGQERILVVEDDPTVRQSLTRILQALGYEVDAVDDGPSALQFLDETGLSPDLVLSDVVLPRGMSGPQIVQAVTQRIPTCRALLMSGYTGKDKNVLQHLADREVRLLSKPFSRQELADRVQEALTS